MTMVKMRALDSFHSDSTIPPGTKVKGDKFEVNADFARIYEQAGTAERIGGSKSDKKEIKNKAEKPEANKAPFAPISGRGGGQTGPGTVRSSSQRGQARKP